MPPQDAQAKMDVAVAIFIPSLDGGGAERAVVALANGIATRGYRVDLVLSAAKGPYLSDVLPQVRVVDLQTPKVIKSLWPLVRYLRHEKPRAMLSALNHANVVAVLARALARVGTRLVVSERTTISVAAAQAQDFFARSVYRLLPWAYRRADAIVAVSQDAARDLERFAQLPVPSVRAIYNPFHLDRIGRLAAEPHGHAWLASGLRPVVLGVGRLTGAKDYRTLIRAFSLIRTRHCARLLILGEGELRGELEVLGKSCGLSDDDFQMPGFVANPFAYLARATLFVLSSGREGLPGVLVEAMACGTPVVSTDCPSGPREILEGGRWGRLVPVGDVDALAQAMDAALSTPRNSLPDTRKRAQDFDQERAVDAYLDTLGLPPRPGAVTQS